MKRIRENGPMLAGDRRFAKPDLDGASATRLVNVLEDESERVAAIYRQAAEERRRTIVGLSVSIGALARQPGERHRRGHHQPTQLAKGHGHDQEGKATYRHGFGNALQHATRHYPAAHRHIVEGKGKRAEGGVKETSKRDPSPIVLMTSRLSAS